MVGEPVHDRYVFSSLFIMYMISLTTMQHAGITEKYDIYIVNIRQRLDGGSQQYYYVDFFFLKRLIRRRSKYFFCIGDI